MIGKFPKAIGADKYNFSYNSLNQLKEIKIHSSENALKKTINYFFDPQGRRIKKIMIDHNDSTKSFSRSYVYDGDHIIAEYNDAGNRLASYAHNLSQMDDILSVEISSSGQDAGLAQNAGKYYYIKDHLGSVDAITDSAGNLVQKYQYSAFGKIVNILDASDNVITSNPKVGASFTFTGREFDKEADMYFYRARVYDPNTGRFLQQDPDPGKMMNSLSVVNKYSYALNNPVLYADPTGKSIFDDIAGYAQVFIGAIVNMVIGLVTLDPAQFLFGVALAFEVILAPINLIRNGRLPKYETYEGMPVVKNSILSEFTGRPGFSLGAGSFVSYDPIPSRLENTIQHEYGHYLQYQAWGPWDYLVTGWEQKGLCGAFLERDADRRATDRFPGFEAAYGGCH